MGYDPPVTLANVISTAFGAGYSPIAPGTAGSAVGLLLFVAVNRLPGAGQLLAIAIAFVGGAVAATATARAVGRKDPGLVVWDEVVGMWTTLALLPFNPWTALFGFVLFRVMDVLKPYPARDLERLPEGWGIMADDLMAGVYAHLLLRAGIFAWGP